MFKVLLFLSAFGFMQCSYADLFDDVEPIGVLDKGNDALNSSAPLDLVEKDSEKKSMSDADEGIADVEYSRSMPLSDKASDVQVSRNVEVKPVSEIDLEAEYRLASGDVVTISVYGEPDLSFSEKRLDENGQISYPFLGAVNANGLTAQELEKLLTKKLKGDFLVDPKVSVNVKEYRLVYISGAVSAAGAFSYTPGMTIRRLATLAGGLLDSASLESITIITATGTGEVVKEGSLDSIVSPGDTIHIPEYKKLFLSGAINSPGSVDFRMGMTVRQAISLAGGLTERASESKIFIIKDGEDDSRNKRVTMDALVSPGDSISIGEGFF